MNRFARLAGAVVVLAGAGLAAAPKADASQTVKFYADDVGITLNDWFGAQTIQVNFEGVGTDADPVEAQTGNVVKFGTVHWNSTGDSLGGFDSESFALTAHQTAPSVDSEAFGGTVAALFTIFGDALFAEFDDTQFNLGGITYDLGLKLDLPWVGPTFVKFAEDVPFQFASIGPDSGSADLYIRLSGQVTPQAVPEPSTMAMGAVGLAALGLIRLVRRRKAS